MSQDPGHNVGEGRRMHNIRNHLSVIVGFCDLLVGEIPESDRKHADILEIRKAADAALALLEGMAGRP